MTAADLFQRYRPLVRSIAWAMARRTGYDFAELENRGLEGLYLAAQRFRPGRAPFGAYARRRVRGAMLDALRAAYHGPKGTFRRGYEGPRYQLVDVDELAVRSAAPDPEDALARAELLDLARLLVESLPAQQRELVRRHYLDGEPFKSIAADLGLTKSWACRVQQSALRALRAMAVAA